MVAYQAATCLGTRGEVLDLTTGEWVEIPPMPDDNPDVINRSFVATGTSLFVFGGESWTDGRGENLDETLLWAQAG